MPGFVSAKFSSPPSMTRETDDVERVGFDFNITSMPLEIVKDEK